MCRQTVSCSRQALLCDHSPEGAPLKLPILRAGMYC